MTDFGDIYLLPDEPKQCGFLNETLDSNEEQKLNRKIGTAYSLSSEVCILKLSPDLEEGYLNQIAEKVFMTYESPFSCINTVKIDPLGRTTITAGSDHYFHS